MADETLEWIGYPVADGGTVEESFRLIRAGAAVPGVLWRPAASAVAPPLVLLGHGGSGKPGAIVLWRDFVTSHLNIAS